MDNLTPTKIVEYLDKYIIGQDQAKRAVAIALRNRWRRMQLPQDIAEEIIPKNILIIGPTGVGKTEIARRIAKLTKSPFIKVEASKFTEVGYVGRDVESMVRDITEIAVNMIRNEHRKRVRTQAEKAVEERLLDLIIPKPDLSESDQDAHEAREQYQRTREKFRTKLRSGRLDEKIVEMDIKENYGGLIEVFSSSGIEEIGMQMKDMVPGLFNQRKKRRRVSVEDARRILIDEEQDRLVDMDKIIHDAVRKVETSGIVFLDEVDKVAGKESGRGPDVSREGVQRDLLPIIEGTSVTTKYGIVKTNHILFIAAGAFSVSKPSDLIPELQGRFPVKVDVHSLSRDHLRRILIEPKNALTLQYQALLSTEDVDLEFSDTALNAVADLAERVNMESENIGARRLHTIMELLLEDYSFHASEMSGQKITIDEQNVKRNVNFDKIIVSENVRIKRRPGFL